MVTFLLLVLVLAQKGKARQESGSTCKLEAIFTNTPLKLIIDDL